MMDVWQMGKQRSVDVTHIETFIEVGGKVRGKETQGRQERTPPRSITP